MAVGGAGRTRRCTLTRASSTPDEEDRASGGDEEAEKSYPAPQQPSQPPAEPASDKFLPVVMVLAYAGLLGGFALAIDWGYIFSEVRDGLQLLYRRGTLRGWELRWWLGAQVLGLGGGFTADDLDTAAMWNSVR